MKIGDWSDPRPHRIVKVTLPDGSAYRTVQVDIDGLFGPPGSTLEVEYSQLTLKRALELRDALNGR